MEFPVEAGPAAASPCSTTSGRSFLGRNVVLASGLTDELPPVPGLRECWGRTVFSCPYCLAYEFRDRPLGVLANGPIAFAAVALMLAWSCDLVLFTQGPAQLGADERVMSEFVLISLREMNRHLAERDEYFRTETLPTKDIACSRAASRSSRCRFTP